MTVSAVRLLPEPDSPTTAKVSPSHRENVTLSMTGGDNLSLNGKKERVRASTLRRDDEVTAQR
jgi:hypothetical protein